MALHDLNEAYGYPSDTARFYRSHPSKSAEAIRAFLQALDRGHLGWDAQIGPAHDRCETAFVTMLREALANDEAAR
jgi:hypothetical protein